MAGRNGFLHKYVEEVMMEISFGDYDADFEGECKPPSISAPTTPQRRHHQQRLLSIECLCNILRIR